MPAAAGQASACLLPGRTHKYLDEPTLLSPSDCLQVETEEEEEAERRRHGPTEARHPRL